MFSHVSAEQVCLSSSLLATEMSYDVSTAMTACLIIGLSEIADTSKSCITCLNFSFHCCRVVMAALSLQPVALNIPHVFVLLLYLVRV